MALLFPVRDALTRLPLLFPGLGTRIATLPWLGMIGVIQVFVYPDAWVEHLVWASILLFLLMRGLGVVSHGGLPWQGRWVWAWKDLIDRRFMRKYRDARAR